MRLPSKENSFQKRVPTGKFHSSGFVSSIVVPGGSATQRCLAAPSDQSGTAGAYDCTPGAIVFDAKSA